jgi:predicted dehydrogenase
MAMRHVKNGEIAAVCSRSADRAADFAGQWSVARCYTNYDRMLAAEDIDVVYVATPHSHHEEATVAALEAGKPVLCEKPFALNVPQAARMVATARAQGLFLMDAIWSRYLPAYQSMMDIITSGRIGEPVLVEGDFGFRTQHDSSHRLLARELGGGALLDLGIYPIQLCSLVLGPPDHVAATGELGSTGVDETVAAVSHHPGGGVGVVKSSLRANLTCTARISGTEGAVELPAFHHCPTSIVVVDQAGRRDSLDMSFDGDGLQFEIAEVHRCLSDGEKESPTLPLDETMSLMRTLDEIRRQVGVIYPSEEGQPTGA